MRLKVSPCPSPSLLNVVTVAFSSLSGKAEQMVTQLHPEVPEARVRGSLAREKLVNLLYPLEKQVEATQTLIGKVRGKKVNEESRLWYGWWHSTSPVEPVLPWNANFGKTSHPLYPSGCARFKDIRVPQKKLECACLPWHIPEDLELDRFVGSGRDGQVALFSHKSSGRQVAIKRVSCSNQLRQKATSLIAQLEFSEVLQECPLFAKTELLWGTSCEDEPCTVYVLMEAGVSDMNRDLLDKVLIPNSPEAIKGLKVATQALKHLHSQGLVFCDLDPVNLTRVPDGSYKLIDLGSIRRAMAAQRELGDDETFEQRPMFLPRNRLCCRAEGYLQEWCLDEHTNFGYHIDALAPELLLNVGFATPTMDLWALGVLAYRLIFGKKPFRGPRARLMSSIVAFKGTPTYEELRNMCCPINPTKALAAARAREKLQNFDQVDCPDIRVHVPEFDDNPQYAVAWDFIQRLLQYDPMRRMTAEEALNHPLLRSVDPQESQETDPWPIPDSKPGSRHISLRGTVPCIPIVKRAVAEDPRYLYEAP